MPQHNILVIAHGHPDFSLGGGEIAAYNLFKAYRQHPDVASATFLARVEDPSGWPSGAIGLRREGEYLWQQAVHDRHFFRSVDRLSLRTGLADLLGRLKPSVVHVHHFVHLGLDLLVMLRQLLPQAAIYLTLHEFMAICRNEGQMVKPGTLALCERATPQDCHNCFPNYSAEDFWLRREFIFDSLAVVDGFIAPSAFLRQRYIDWGVPAQRISLIDNGQPERAALPARPLASGESRNRFAYFGQINPFKGLDVLLQGLSLLKKKEQQRLQVQVHAAHLEHQPQALRERITGYLDRLVPSGVVQWCGPYRPQDMPTRLSGIDWVVVPSVWWENSPLVIQEAFVAGRPVVCSNIGGMAEKVQHAHNGWHVPVADAHAWGRTLLHLADTPGLWDALAAEITPPLSHAQCAQRHINLFHGTNLTAKPSA